MAGPVIITRAEPGNAQTASRLATAGMPYICAPMLVLEPTGQDLPDLGSVQGLLFTSANGVRAFCDVSDRRDLMVWCVGPATLAEAQERGFSGCENGDGDGEDLARLVLEKADPEAGGFVHIANEAAAGKLAERLRNGGHEVRFAPLYRANPVPSVSKLVLDELEMGGPCAVLVHSAKGARAFAAHMAGMDLHRHILVAVSEAAAAPLAGAGFGHVAIAERPNEDHLLAALFTAYSTL